MVTTRPDRDDKIRVIDIRKGSCGGRAGNFNMEVRAVREVIVWAGKNKVENILIRSDSTAAIT